MSYIALRALLSESGQIEKWLNDQVKAFQHGLFYGLSILPIPEKFRGLYTDKEKQEET